MVKFPWFEIGGLSEEILAFAMAVCLVAVIVVALWMAFSHRPGPAQRNPEEVEALGRLCSQLEKMERRLDNVETIVKDKTNP